MKSSRGRRSKVRSADPSHQAMENWLRRQDIEVELTARSMESSYFTEGELRQTLPYVENFLELTKKCPDIRGNLSIKHRILLLHLEHSRLITGLHGLTRELLRLRDECGYE